MYDVRQDQRPLLGLCKIRLHDLCSIDATSSNAIARIGFMHDCHNLNRDTHSFGDALHHPMHHVRQALA